MEALSEASMNRPAGPQYHVEQVVCRDTHSSIQPRCLILAPFNLLQARLAKTLTLNPCLTECHIPQGIGRQRRGGE